MIFESTDSYISTDELSMAVDAAVRLERPLLIKGEPGTGKTMLAIEVAKSLGMPLLEWHIKSTTKAVNGLYEYDAVSRLRDSQLGDDRVNDISNYIKKGKLWEAFEAEERVVLLIDEIDKADIEFPNDLLQEIDRMEFYVYELGKTIKAKNRPIVIITSNNEKELPDAFLRRCFFHFINFPDRETMQQIVDVHFPAVKQDLVKEAMEIFTRDADILLEKDALYAYGMSKMPLVKETSENAKYKRIMSNPEFYEMIGRVAEIKFKDQISLSLAEKIGLVLDKILPIAGLKRKNPKGNEIVDES